MTGQYAPPGTTLALSGAMLPAFVISFFSGTVGIHRLQPFRRHGLTTLVVGLFGRLAVPVAVGWFIPIGVGVRWLVGLLGSARRVHGHNPWLGLG
ncbi:MAG: hypothetical protein OYL41_04365 [Acidobacteriota bacterium]|nr:hypothetical protein [Acidobacteriota bacterium]